MKNKATLDESVGSDWTALMESGNTSNNNLERDWTKFKESLKMTNKATLDYVVKQFFQLNDSQHGLHETSKKNQESLNETSKKD